MYDFDTTAVRLLPKPVRALHQFIVFHDTPGGEKEGYRDCQGEKHSNTVVAGLEGWDTAFPPIEKDIQQRGEDECNGDPELFLSCFVVEDIDQRTGDDEGGDHEDQYASRTGTDGARAQRWHGLHLQWRNAIQAHFHIAKVKGELKR